jgi:hypothetical protein
VSTRTSRCRPEEAAGGRAAAAAQLRRCQLLAAAWGRDGATHGTPGGPLICLFFARTFDQPTCRVRCRGSTTPIPISPIEYADQLALASTVAVRLPPVLCLPADFADTQDQDQIPARQVLACLTGQTCWRMQL